MARHRSHEQATPERGIRGRPADEGLSIDRLAQAFAAMMGTGDPYAGEPADGEAEAVVEVDASPDLDEDSAATAEEEADRACRVTPGTILEAMLFVGLPGGEPISAARVAGLMRGVRPQEIDELAAELRDRYAADRCPYELVSVGSGWLMRLREEFRQFGRILEQRARRVRLGEEALDVLALVAWNQPVPRDQLVELGCDARPSTLRQLVRRGLLELVRPEAAGDGGESPEPWYRTTDRFLEIFKLRDLRDLPRPDSPPG